MRFLDWLDTRSKAAFIIGTAIFPILALGFHLLAKSSIPYWSQEGPRTLVALAGNLLFAPVGSVVFMLLALIMWIWPPLWILAMAMASVANGVCWAAISEHLVQTRESSSMKFRLTLGALILWWVLVLGSIIALGFGGR